MIPWRHLGLLLFIFAFTVAIRVPHLGRPMGKHHEFCTATALRVLTVWQQEGIATVGYNPATNFAGVTNKHINNHASGSGQVVDAQGNYYYVSHPPLAYYLPYVVFSLFGVEADVIPLQLFNLFVNLLCGLGIYLLALHLLPSNNRVGVVGVGIYWLIPATLWFQGNVYMSDMLVQPFFIGALLLALAITKKPRPFLLIALGGVCFLGTYTTWFGVLIAAGMGIYFVWHSRQRPSNWVVVSVLVLSQVLAIGLMTWQYSQIAGWDAYWAELLQRFGMRSYKEVKENPILFPTLIALSYVINYGLLLISAVVAWRLHSKHTSIPRLGAFIFMGLVPIILMHLLLTNYTGHDFTTLYLAVPLSVGVAVVAVSQHQKWFWSMLATSLALGIIFYVAVNPYGQTNFFGDRYDAPLQEGQLLKQEPSNAVLFILGSTPSPEALWYGKRNVLPIAAEAEAIQFLRDHEMTKGVIFARKRGGGIERVKTISL